MNNYQVGVRWSLGMFHEGRVGEYERQWMLLSFFRKRKRTKKRLSASDLMSGSEYTLGCVFFYNCTVLKRLIVVAEKASATFLGYWREVVVKKYCCYLSLPGEGCGRGSVVAGRGYANAKPSYQHEADTPSYPPQGGTSALKLKCLTTQARRAGKNRPGHAVALQGEGLFLPWLFAIAHEIANAKFFGGGIKAKEHEQ